ncbi:hypothetical protein [Streptomyces minutiscleroticus]|nr:hypothetical protein [Streptomyces minutiscleroticus]
MSPQLTIAMPPAAAAAAVRRAVGGLCRCEAAADVEVINPHP